MYDSISRISNFGFIPDTIIDIGARHGEWSQNVLGIFPNSKYYLYEPIEYEELNKFRNFSNFKISHELLFDSERDIEWFEMRNSGDSIFKERTYHFDNCQPIIKMTKRIDDILDIDIIKSSLMKIDTQGSELPILRGAKNLLSKVEFLILELPFFGQYNKDVPDFREHINEIDKLGFVVFEVADVHWVGGFMAQVDIMFVNKNSKFIDIAQTCIEGRKVQ